MLVPPSWANVPETISTELPNSKKHEKSDKPANETESPMEIGAWPKFPSTEIFLKFEIPTPISPIPDLEKINDDSIQETAKVPNSIRLSTVEKKTERKNGQVNETFVPPKTEAKGQLISKGFFGVFKSTKKPTIFFQGFLS